MATETTCRSCGGVDLRLVLSLGNTPLANSYISPQDLDRPESFYPLDVVMCRSCALVQITETVPPEDLFRNYMYFSSFSETMLRHAQSLASRLIAAQELGRDSLVVEIASNDGYLLQYYRDAGIPVLGIEPAQNIAQIAEDHGIPSLSEFFDEQLAVRLVREGRQADVLHAHNVLAHVADLNGVVAGMYVLLKDSGIAVIEVPYVKDLVDHAEFDTIYHEHLCYFSVTALDRLFRRHGLLLLDVEHVNIHGGSLRLSVGKRGAAAPSVAAWLQQEQVWGVDDERFYLGFGARVSQVRGNLRADLGQLKAQGKRIAAYGASAKGCTLLHYCQIGPETLDFVVDRSVVKQGYYTPGTHLPIYAPQHLLDTMPDYVLLLTWNFADEILAQQSEYRQRGGRFIIPLPEAKVI